VLFGKKGAAVTAGSRGIGRAIAQRLAQRGVFSLTQEQFKEP
jgi:NAD(P)-dependent dehydrogenase (short-subunit alcohol dehydrogenase family)